MRIDLHTHSHASDGTDAPAELMAAAARAGLDVVALTDHDTTRGWDEATAAVPTTGVALVRGLELSCRWGPMSVHLLSYLHDPHEPALRAETDAIREARLSRARHMVDLIAADHPLTWDDVLAQTEPGTTVGRPHVADALVAKGVVADRSAAFTSILSARSPYYVPHHAPDVLRAVGLVRAAGGVPVLAHPGALTRGRILPDDVVRELAAAGLAGIEVDHRDHDAEQRARLGALAAELGLLVTGASDYHGEGKPNLLGEGTTSREALAAIEDAGAIEVVRPWRA
ncbi:PHP domain-containing protein [Cellulomonas sp. APG4]|uniref:PHP domain-containing protein n=1 Tax=Cellulomonas sp. APG4 TaxID=1538656 RepID=UPI001379717E|nr:PHP domain-containing protein [Cellulomonas sp. APG4]